MGGSPDRPDLGPPSVDSLLVRAGERAVVAGSGDVVLEDATVVELSGPHLPPDLPLGYHRLVSRSDGSERPLIVVPHGAALPPDLRVWALTCQLYAARSSHSWGIGDLADLATIVGWATGHGAALVGLNPLHAADPAGPTVDSPYSPSSRRWRDPLYLAIEQVPGADVLLRLGGPSGLADDQAAALALNDGDRIDRTAVWDLKRAALELLWSRFRATPSTAEHLRFDRYRADRGADLQRWATWCALADHHGRSWRDWPLEHRHPEAAGVARFATDRADSVSFWAWLQWLADEQFEAAGGAHVITDLAVGFHPDGADAWQWQDLLADGVRIGAPPDLLGPDGQDWGLPPFVPWRLRAAGYEPIATTLRAALRGSGGIRIDHVMGLFRLWWIPPDRPPSAGAYVRFPGHDLLGIVALESARSGAVVIGEDLGTVEAGVREALAAAGVLSTRLLLFEDEPTDRWPHQAMAAVTTHDLPTMAGLWSGTDLDDRRRAGVRADEADDVDLIGRLGLEGADDLDGAVVDAHRRLAASPCMVAAATLDDLVGAEHRPNLPGTIDEHPNWRIPLPIRLDDLDGLRRAEAVAGVLALSRRSEPDEPASERTPQS